MGYAIIFYYFWCLKCSRIMAGCRIRNILAFMGKSRLFHHTVVQETHNSSCGQSKLPEHAIPTKNGIHNFEHTRRNVCIRFASRSQFVNYKKANI